MNSICSSVSRRHEYRNFKERFLTQLVNTEPKRDARIAAIAAIAGIGNPDRFFSHLKGLGVPLHACRAFPDHHPFTAADFADIDAEIILMTEKDAVKCAAFAVADADLSSGKQQLWQMQIDGVEYRNFKRPFSRILNVSDDRQAVKHARNL